MSKKEKYINNLNNGRLDIITAFEYYKSKGGKADIELFQQLVNFDTQSIIDTLNVEFEVVKVEDKNGKIIKYM